MSRRTRSLAVAAAVLVSATGCSGQGGDPAPGAGTVDTGFGPGDSYVALGDSYTAGPGITRKSLRNACFRSEANYPHRVADEAGLDLTDLSCSGAATTSIGGDQAGLTGATLPPQARRLDDGTDLVTISIGANDFALYATFSALCVRLAEDDPTGAPCTRADRGAGDDSVEARLGRLRERLDDVLRLVERKAPEALVLVVGYPVFAPEARTCEAYPVARGDLALLHDLNVGLNDALREAAAAADLTYVDVAEATAGHDVCSADPWVAGADARRGRGVPWHPYAEEQEAVAELVLEAIGEA